MGSIIQVATYLAIQNFPSSSSKSLWEKINIFHLKLELRSDFAKWIPQLSHEKHLLTFHEMLVV